MRVQFASPPKLILRPFDVPIVHESLPKITSQKCTLGFKRCGHLQIFASGAAVALSNSRKTTSQPRVAQGWINGNGFVEGVHGPCRMILRIQDESFERPRL